MFTDLMLTSRETIEFCRIHHSTRENHAQSARGKEQAG
jgi:hypothetical protein